MFKVICIFGHVLTVNIVNRGDWLGNPANIKRRNKDAKIYVGRSATLHNLLFCAHTLCMSYITNTFLLVSSSVRSKQLLCFVQGQDQKTEQKRTTKNFDEFFNHSPLLTMIQLRSVSIQQEGLKEEIYTWPKLYSTSVSLVTSSTATESAAITT